MQCKCTNSAVSPKSETMLAAKVEVYRASSSTTFCAKGCLCLMCLFKLSRRPPRILASQIWQTSFAFWCADLSCLRRSLAALKRCEHRGTSQACSLIWHRRCSLGQVSSHARIKNTGSVRPLVVSHRQGRLGGMGTSHEAMADLSRSQLYASFCWESEVMGFEK